MKHPERILLVGDLHANARAAAQVVDHAQALRADLILQVGDFGFWPRDRAGQRYLRDVDARLREAAISLWFIPGNHEDWSALRRLPTGDDGLSVVAERIREVPVGHRWTWGGGARWPVPLPATFALFATPGRRLAAFSSVVGRPVHSLVGLAMHPIGRRQQDKPCRSGH